MAEAEKKKKVSMPQEEDILRHPTLAKHGVDLAAFRSGSWQKMEEVLEWLENKGQPPRSPAFVKKAPSGNSWVRYKCSACDNTAESMVSTFFKKTVYACARCNAGLINQIFKPIASEKIQKEIEGKGFKVLSQEHRTLTDGKWTLQCENGHVFERTGAAALSRLNACPSCHVASAEEAMVRCLVEAHFKKPFPNVRPDWMASEATGRILELDMLNEEESLAIEYHGPQHFLPLWGEDRLAKSRRNDAARRVACEKKGIRLIELKYIETTVVSDTVFLEKAAEQLRAHGVPIAKDLPARALGVVQKLYLNRTGEVIENIKKKLAEYGRTWVRGSYVNSQSKITVVCANGHERKLLVAALYNKNSKKCGACAQGERKNRNASGIFDRHKRGIDELCRENRWSFTEMIRNKAGHITGFRFEDASGKKRNYGHRLYLPFLKRQREEAERKEQVERKSSD